MTVCQRYRLTPEQWRAMPDEDRETLLAWELRNENEFGRMIEKLNEDEEHAMYTPDVYVAIRLARMGL